MNFLQIIDKKILVLDICNDLDFQMVVKKAKLKKKFIDI